MKKISLFDKAYLGRVTLYVALTVLAVGVMFYIGYHMTGDTRGGIDTVYAVSDTIPRTVKGEAYIIRDEYPITDSIGGGFLSPSVRDGDKVTAGGKVADVYSTSSSSVSKKITLIEEQIAFYKKCQKTFVTVGDTSGVHNDISETVINIRRQTVSGDTSYALKVKPSLTMSIRRLGVLTGRVTDFESQIKSLEAELSNVKSTLGTAISTVYAPKAGYYFSTTDGYENAFSAKNVESVTYSEIADAIENISSMKPQAGSAGKIITGFKWYAACRMTSAESTNFKVDGTYSVGLKDNPEMPLEMKVKKILTNAAEAVVLFECTSIPDGYDFTRLQEFEATYEETKAFKVPVSAVRVHEEMQGVYILDEVTVKFRRISVIEEENGFYLCYATDPEEGNSDYAYLRENDNVITSGTGLYVGMTYNPEK